MTMKRFSLLAIVGKQALFALATVLLITPWASFFLRELGLQQELGYLSFLFLQSVAAIVVANWANLQSSVSSRYGVVGAYLLGSLLFLLVFQLPLGLFGPLSLGLLLAGQRFFQYSAGLDFTFDFILAMSFMTLTLLMGEQLGFEVPLLNVLAFFAVGVILAVVFNTDRMKQIGHSANRRASLTTVVAILLLTVLIAGLLSSIVSQELVIATGRVIWYGYDILVDGFLLLLYPFLRLLEPVFNWFVSLGDNLELHTLEEESPLAVGEIFRDSAYGDQALDPSLPPWATFILFALLVGLLIILVLKDIRAPQGQAAREGCLEERESVFSAQALIKDMQSLVSGIPLRILLSNRDAGNDPVSLVRRYYVLAVRHYRKLQEFGTADTPNAYLKKLSHGTSQLESLNVLTRVYNRARYGEQATRSDVGTAKRSLQQIRKSKR